MYTSKSKHQVIQLFDTGRYLLAVVFQNFKSFWIPEIGVQKLLKNYDFLRNKREC